MTADKRGGLVVPCKPPRNHHRIRNPAIFTLISPSIQDSCLFSYLSFSTSYFSTPPGYVKTKKVLHTFRTRLPPRRGKNPRQAGNRYSALEGASGVWVRRRRCL